MASLFVSSILALLLARQTAQLQAGSQTAEERALAYLSREVPQWFEKNQCYSCHNNGDAARALYQAIRLSYAFPSESLANTTAWLAKPRQWDRNRGDPAFSDKGLARIQFAAALAEAMDAGQTKDRSTLIEAARLVAENQRPDGSWQIDASGTIGSPVTYGASLATATARRLLEKVGRGYFRNEIEAADRWLRAAHVQNILDAAAVTLGLEGSEDAKARAQLDHCLSLMRRGQSGDGGWGPYLGSPPEPFDTALVLLALSRFPNVADLQTMRARGRAFLITSQSADGSWPETTRPAGAESYAQRLSTTGWATQALLATR